MHNFSNKDNESKRLSVPFDINFQFSGIKYEVKKAECFVKDIKESYVYSIDILPEICGEADCKTIVAFVDGQGKDIAKLYTESGKAFTTREGTAGLRVEVYAVSSRKGSLKLNGIVLSVHGKAKKRKAVLAAVAVAYNKGRRTIDRNLKETLDAIDNAAKEKPDIIVASECFYGRNVWNKPFGEKILELDGEEIKLFRDKAKKYHTYICFSAHIYLENGNPANLGIIIGRNGETVGTYAKTHITMSELSKHIEPGAEIKTFDLDFGRVGIAICWDLFFPELARVLQLKGCEVILNPTAGFEEERTRERAKECGAFIVTAGTQKLRDTIITAPDGRVISRRSGNRDYISAEVDLNEEFYVGWLSCPSSSTRKNVFKYERRPELYI